MSRPPTSDGELFLSDHFPQTLFDKEDNVKEAPMKGASVDNQPELSVTEPAPRVVRATKHPRSSSVTFLPSDANSPVRERRTRNTPLLRSFHALSTKSGDAWGFESNSPSVDDIAQHFDQVVQAEQQQRQNQGDALPLFAECLPVGLLAEGAQSIVNDDFSKCFESRDPPSWNWNAYLYPAWVLGVIIRYGILFPLRLTLLLVGSFSAAIAFLLTYLFVHGKAKFRYYRSIVSFVAMVFVASWSGVVRFHGTKPKRRANQIFVANHTTVMDVSVLLQWFTYSLVGQKHGGGIGFLQETLLAPLECIWFQRGESRDREAAGKRIREHIGNEQKNPLLIFPEGTCVNNEYVVQFKKGAFALGEDVIVHPIAIKYDREYADMFYNSRIESLYWHLFRLMTSWCVVCHVYYLEPVMIEKGESHEDFAQRVKTMICRAAKLKDSPYDGYMKYWKPSARYKESKQKAFANKLRLRYQQIEARKENATRNPLEKHAGALHHRNPKAESVPY